MRKIELIKKQAIELGGCPMVSSINSFQEAVTMLKTPQGREFAIKTGFPSLKTWRENKENVEGIPDLYLDQNGRVVVNRDCICVGESEVKIELDNPDRLYHIVLMHGAKVEIKATNYAVATVTCINAIPNIIADETAILTIEQ